MIRSELIQKLADENPHLYQRDVEKIVNTIFDSMVDALVKGDRIEIRGFGSFSLHYRPPRMGRNPKTGEAVALGTHPRMLVGGHHTVVVQIEYLERREGMLVAVDGPGTVVGPTSYGTIAVVAGGVVYVQADDGTVAALRAGAAAGGTPPASAVAVQPAAPPAADA